MKRQEAELEVTELKMVRFLFGVTELGMSILEGQLRLDGLETK